MSSTYSPGLALQLIGTGDQAGQWGISTDVNLGTLIESAIAGYVVQTFADVDLILPMPLGADGGTGTPASPVTARNMFISCVGTNTIVRNLILPLNKKIYFINNSTTGGFAIIAKCSGGDTGVSIPNGSSALLVCTGANILSAANYFPTLYGPVNVTATTGVTWTINGVSGQYTASFVGNSATGNSYGPRVFAGTNASDQCAVFSNQTGSRNNMILYGDGSITVGVASTPQGVGTVNAAGLFINGVSVLTSVVNISGNAATATALQNARTINGTSFNGTANITVTADATTLTGTTLHSTVSVPATQVNSGTLPLAQLNANVYRGTLGSGAITAQNNGSPSGGANGDIFLIY